MRRDKSDKSDGPDGSDRSDRSDGELLPERDDGGPGEAEPDK